MLSHLRRWAKHKDGRETFGHSLVVDPWGTIILELNGSNEELGFCDVDVARKRCALSIAKPCQSSILAE